MAMKKAEMESHAEDYQRLIALVRKLLHEKQYVRATRAALQAWEHIDGMMRYARKYEDREFATIEAIEVVLRYAPLVFDVESLDRLEALLKEKRAIEKNTEDELSTKLDAARLLMKEAHALWTHIEANGVCRQDYLRRDLGGDQEIWRNIAETWEKMGLLKRTPIAGSYELELVTRMGSVVSAKCSACGGVHEAPMGMFLEPQQCPECSTNDYFVMLSQ